MEARLANRIDGLEVKIDDIQDAIGDALMLSTDTLADQLKDHEHRLIVLERHAAECPWCRRAAPEMSAPAARVVVCSSAWAAMVPRIGADAYQEGRATGCLA